MFERLRIEGDTLRGVDSTAVIAVDCHAPVPSHRQVQVRRHGHVASQGDVRHVNARSSGTYANRVGGGNRRKQTSLESPPEGPSFCLSTQFNEACGDCFFYREGDVRRKALVVFCQHPLKIGAFAAPESIAIRLIAADYLSINGEF